MSTWIQHLITKLSKNNQMIWNLLQLNRNTYSRRNYQPVIERIPSHKCSLPNSLLAKNIRKIWLISIQTLKWAPVKFRLLPKEFNYHLIWALKDRRRRKCLNINWTNTYRPRVRLNFLHDLIRINLRHQLAN